MMRFWQHQYSTRFKQRSTYLLTFIACHIGRWSSGLKILNVQTPGAIENGTRSTAILDCNYEIEHRDISTLEIKWYFRHDPTPIFTWVPPGHPIVSPSFKRYINLGYLASNNPLSQHRALFLQPLSSNLSGRYACRVSSIYEDHFKTANLTIFVKPEAVALNVRWVGTDSVNITCSATRIYPEPFMKILVKFPGQDMREDFSNAASKSFTWSNGAFNASLSKVVRVKYNVPIPLNEGETAPNKSELLEVPATCCSGQSLDAQEKSQPEQMGKIHDEAIVVRCEVTLPGVPDYLETQQIAVPSFAHQPHSGGTRSTRRLALITDVMSTLGQILVARTFLLSTRDLRCMY